MDANFNDFTPGELASTEASASYLVRLPHPVLSPEVHAALADLLEKVQDFRASWGQNRF
jgi:hypothetical protein